MISTHSTKDADIIISILQTEKLRLKYVSRLDHFMLIAAIITSALRFNFKIPNPWYYLISYQ